MEKSIGLKVWKPVKTEACQTPNHRRTGSGHFRKLRPFTQSQVTPASYYFNISNNGCYLLVDQEILSLLE